MMDYSSVITASYIKFLRDQITYYKKCNHSAENYEKIIQLSAEVHNIELMVNKISSRLASVY